MKNCTDFGDFHENETYCHIVSLRRGGMLSYSYKGYNEGGIIMETRLCNIQRFFTAVKKTIFSRFFFYYFHIFAQNIDCGFTLEPPQ